MLITIFATRIIFYSISILIGDCMEKKDLSVIDDLSLQAIKNSLRL
jgi:hypothetical protein